MRGNNMLAIKNAKIVLENEILDGKVLLLSDKIEGIVDSIPENCEVIDAEGGYVTPGFIDLHIHGYLITLILRVIILNLSVVNINL